MQSGSEDNCCLYSRLLFSAPDYTDRHTLSDITGRKQAEDAIRELSLVDELTGLRNRRGIFVLGRADAGMPVAGVQVATQVRISSHGGAGVPGATGSSARACTIGGAPMDSSMPKRATCSGCWRKDFDPRKSR